MYLNSELGNSPDAVNAYAASTFFAVDRFASYVKFWKEFYGSEGIVIADRYTTSNAVYHMNKLPMEKWDSYLVWLEDFEYKKIGLPRPDSVIYLHVPTEVSQGLIKKRYEGDISKKDLHEKDVNFLKACSCSAEYAIKKLGWKKVNCCEQNKIMPQESISEKVFEIAMEVLDVRL